MRIRAPFIANAALAPEFTRCRSWRIFILIALLLAQLGAGLHALDHADEASDQPHDAVCELCLAFAQLAFSLPSAPPPALPIAQSPPVVPQSVLARWASDWAPPYNVRAPPCSSWL